MSNGMNRLTSLCNEKGIDVEDALSLLNTIVDKLNFDMLYKLLGYKNVQNLINGLNHDQVIDLIEMNSASRSAYEYSDGCVSGVANNEGYLGDLMTRVKADIDERGIYETSSMYDSFTLLCLALYNDDRYQREAGACADAERKLADSFK